MYLSRLIQSFLSLLLSTGQGEYMSSQRILSCFLDGWSLTRPFLSPVPSFLVLNFVSTIKREITCTCVIYGYRGNRIGRFLLDKFLIAFYVNQRPIKWVWSFRTCCNITTSFMFFKNLVEDNGRFFWPAKHVAMDTTRGRHGGGSICLSFK